jgi:hypothetical protein
LGAAQDPIPRAPSDLIPAAGLTPGRDSFTILVNGLPLGSIQASLERTAEGYRFRESTRLAGLVEQDTEIITDARLRTRTVTQAGKVQGEETRIALTVEGERIRGTAVTPGAGGLQTVEIDTVLGLAVLDDNLLQTLLPALPWDADTTFSMALFSSGSGETRVVTLVAEGQDVVDLSGTEVECHRIRLDGGPQQITFWISVASPRRLMRIVIANSPVEIVRANP